MDFINKSFQQLGDLFKAMSPAARVTAGLLLAVVVISLVYLYRFQANSPNDYLLGARAFSSNELAVMEGAFSQAALNQYEIEGSKVRIPRSQRASYLAALAEHNALPRNFESILAEALADSRPFESQKARDQRVEYALQQTLSQTISNMEGIESATVFYDEVVERGLRSQRQVTALVSVQPTGSGNLDNKLVDSIRGFVAAAKAGLRPEDVAVTDLASGKTYQSTGGDELSHLDNLYAERKQSYEQNWRENILRHLSSFIPGVQVGVNVVLDPQLQSRSFRDELDPKPVPIRNSESTHRVSRNSGRPGGQPGVVPNVGVPNVSASLTSNEEDSETSESEVESIPSRTQRLSIAATLVPEQVTVSVIVPSDHYVSLWHDQNPPEEGEEPGTPEDGALQQIEQELKTKIEDQVAKMIPAPPQGENVYPHVVVTSFQRLSSPEPEPPGFSDTASSWFAAHGSNAAMVIVGLFGLLVLRGVVRGGTTPSPVAQGAESDIPLRIHEGEQFEETDDEIEPATRRKRRFGDGGPSLRDELADMVREDPDAAANILKTWISDAA